MNVCSPLFYHRKRTAKQCIVPQLLRSFYHYFPLTMTCIHNEVWGCAESHILNSLLGVLWGRGEGGARVIFTLVYLQKNFVELLPKCVT